MKNKIGSYINNLMTTIRNTEEQGHLRQLALEELKNLNEVEHQYFKHWTCSICGEHTHEVDYDYLSGTDHLGCVLKKEEFFREKENNQLEINFGEEE